MAWTLRSRQAVALILLVYAPFSPAESLRAYLENRKGIQEFSNKQYFPSYQSFLKAMSQDPLNPDLQMNLGLTFEQNEEWEKAEKAYLSAQKLAAGDKRREFMANFNLAGAQAKKGDIDIALSTYQAALELEPDSLEVKTNIELLSGQQGKGKSKDGKGDGKDEGKDPKDQDKDGKDKDKDKNKEKNYQQPEKNKQPKPFQSKDLSKEDVRKIIDEINNQEQSIRAKEIDKGPKQERTRDKDW